MKRVDKIVNGDLLREMIISGANNLFNHYPEIDALNVFPVPDGDTGTNMNLTMTSGCKEIENIRNDNISEVAKLFSRGLLMGARGNSGVILSQIFRGFSKGLADLTEVSVDQFADGFVKGAEGAYKAVMKPTEGTILTVIRESSAALKEVSSTNLTITDALEILLEKAQVSLEHTPELLPVLKEVGVVDSGGAGLVRIIEGMYKCCLGESVKRGNLSTDLPKEEAKKEAKDTKYIYTCNFVLKIVSAVGKKRFDKEKFEEILKGLGENPTINYKDNYINVIIKTSRPGTILNSVQNFGEFAALDISSSNEEKFEEDFFKKEEPWNDFAIIATSLGQGLDELFKGLGVSYLVSGGQTMNPSTEDFAIAIEKVHAKNVILLPNNKNIIMAAQQAAELANECNVEVVPTKTLPQGLEACMFASFNGNIKDSVKEMNSAIKNVKSGSVTFSIKDTKIDGIDIKKDHFMGIGEGKILCCKESKQDAAKELLRKLCDKNTSIVTIIYGEDIDENSANDIAKFVTDTYRCDVEVHKGDQPVYSYLFGVE